MTPKEKARELVDKYLCIEEIYNVDLFCDECGIDNAAKYCALIAVDEIFKLRLLNKQICGYEIMNSGNIEYWEEVKQEIEKL
jgi:hypothetical protein